MSTARAVTALAEVIFAAQQQKKTAMGVALAVDAAQMLMSPETAAELAALKQRVAELEAAQSAVRYLHLDSVAGPCPTCFDGDAHAAGGDGLVPYPCPTARAAGAVDVVPTGRPLYPVLVAPSEVAQHVREGLARLRAELEQARHRPGWWPVMFDPLLIVAVMFLAWGFGVALVFRIIPATPDAVIAVIDAVRDVRAFLFSAARRRKTGAFHV